MRCHSHGEKRKEEVEIGSFKEIEYLKYQDIKSTENQFDGRGELV